jgi:Ca2+-binding EF-hand superfamily protein
LSDRIGYIHCCFSLSDPRKLRMISRRTAMTYIAMVGTAAIGTLLGGSLGVQAKGGRAASFAAIDTDRDGTLNLDEVKRAAADLFDELDTNHDGTLTRRELGRRRLSARAFAAADTDKDGTLSKDEYLALVERLFKAADVDHDGTLSPAEFRSAVALRRLIH